MFCLPVVNPQCRTTVSSNDDDDDDDDAIVVDGDAAVVDADDTVDDDWVETSFTVVESACVASTVVESITAVVVAAGKTIIVPIMLG